MKGIVFQTVTRLALGILSLWLAGPSLLFAQPNSSSIPPNSTLSPSSSPFFQLSDQILQGSLVCSYVSELDRAERTTHKSRCFSADTQLRWAFADEIPPPLCFASHPHKLPREEQVEQHLVIQPLHVHLGKYTPLFKQFYTPMGKTAYMSVGEQPPADKSWLKQKKKGKQQPSENAIERLLSTDSEIESVPICYRYNMDRSSAVIAGVGWIYDIADTTGMSETFAEMGYDTTERMAALNLTLGYSFNAFTLTGGYIHAIENHNELEKVAQEGQEKDPTAWRSQLAYNTRLLNRPAMFAVGYQKSSETLCHYLPEERYTTKASILLRNRTTLSLEYYQDREYAGGDGADDGDAYGITTKLGFQF